MIVSIKFLFFFLLGKGVLKLICELFLLFFWYNLSLYIFLFFFLVIICIVLGMGVIKEKLNLYRLIYEDRIEKFFKNFGFFLLKYFRKMLICCIIVNLLLVLGIMNIEF